MSSQVFYRKWRPQTLAEVVGQEQITRTLLNALGAERISHAYLFCGPRGTGKTSTGRVLAKAVNCLENGKGEPCNACEMCLAISEGRCLDVIEVDAASNTGVDDIRSLREKVNYAPNQARFKVYIIDEVHMLSTSASNALLKTLEEPPPHVIFILATTETHKILPTILSRCQRFDFRRLSQADVADKLAQISEKEGIGIEPDALKLVAGAATGSLRDAENLLQQLTTYYGNNIQLQQVRDLLGITGDQRTRELARQIIAGDIPAGIATINAVNNDGLDLRHFNRELVAYLRLLLLAKTGASDTGDIPADDLDEINSLVAGAPLSRILRAVKLFGQLELGLDNYATLPLELALIEVTLPSKSEDSGDISQSEPVTVAPKAAATVRRTEGKPTGTTTIKSSQKPEEPVANADAGDISISKTGETSQAADQVKPAEKPNPQPEEPYQALGSEIEQLQANWSRLINTAPGGMGKTPVAALLRSAKPLSIENDTIVVSFKFAYHKEKMDNLDNQKTADKIVSSFLGHPCRVCCVYEHEKNHLVKAALSIGAQFIEEET